MDDAKAIGQTLLALRRNLQMSQKALAAKAKLAVTTVYHHEHGHKAPTTEDLLRYCKVLRVSFDEFMALHATMKQYRERSPNHWLKAAEPAHKTVAQQIGDELSRVLGQFGDDIVRKLDHR